eukprot:CAMPEP_0175039820 /NCGR_PEP_ID=MMETSP0052_2-20121109/856_1 /TAXON_ID=51329 ORGANISM="Polytomella parva, Strain SAG 63-3" /NCGR_SAMPLE_ID=MMETSP0052_2 /ASSEMBLY_ACC=CAM_ASM_000194 /LENGTH=503 /DNA_ID=CAMNT_0016301835 /DNA_START=106 /DNA_END=1614 /DNA_ORIENTATION=+
MASPEEVVLHEVHPLCEVNLFSIPYPGLSAHEIEYLQEHQAPAVLFLGSDDSDIAAVVNPDRRTVHIVPITAPAPPTLSKFGSGYASSSSGATTCRITEVPGWRNNCRGSQDLTYFLSDAQFTVVSPDDTTIHPSFSASLFGPQATDSMTCSPFPDQSSLPVLLSTLPDVRVLDGFGGAAKKGLDATTSYGRHVKSLKEQQKGRPNKKDDGVAKAMDSSDLFTAASWSYDGTRFVLAGASGNMYIINRNCDLLFAFGLPVTWFRQGGIVSVSLVLSPSACEAAFFGSGSGLPESNSNFFGPSSLNPDLRSGGAKLPAFSNGFMSGADAERLLVVTRGGLAYLLPVNPSERALESAKPKNLAKHHGEIYAAAFDYRHNLLIVVGSPLPSSSSSNSQSSSKSRSKSAVKSTTTLSRPAESSFPTSASASSAVQVYGGVTQAVASQLTISIWELEPSAVSNSLQGETWLNLVAYFPGGEGRGQGNNYSQAPGGHTGSGSRMSHVME